MHTSVDSQTPRRSLLSRLAIALAVFVAASIAAEFGYRAWLRVLGTPYDSTDVAERVHTIRTSFANALPKPRAAVNEVDSLAPDAERAMLHPFFGYEFIDTAARTLRDAEYFRTPQAEQNFDVVVLGGSVAGNFVNGGVDGLKEAFAADPRFAKRRVRVFVQGRAAFKEPQQLGVLEYLFGLGFQPDAVVALDGFNEVAVALENTAEDVASIYPNASTWMMLTQSLNADPDVIEKQMAMRELHTRTIAQASTFEEWHLERSAVLGTAALKRIEFTRKSTLAKRSELMKAIHDGGHDSPLRGPVRGGDDRDVVRQSVHVWFEAAVSLQAICSARNVEFLEVLQPTLYDEGSKPLTKKEIDQAKSVPSWQIAVKLGYPLLRAAGVQLADRGVHYLDGSQLFAEYTGDLYYDACHFDEKGEHLVGAAIGHALLADLDERGEPIGKAR